MTFGKFLQNLLTIRNMYAILSVQLIETNAGIEQKNIRKFFESCEKFVGLPSDEGTLINIFLKRSRTW